MTDVDLSSPLIVGFGVVGRALAQVLVGRGHRPVVIEDRPSDEASAAAAECGVVLIEAPGPAQLARLVAEATVLLPSPGVPDRHPVFAASSAVDLPVRSEFDLARLWDDRPILAITGTNGKTSVTMLVTEALTRSGVSTAAVGNTDVPLIAAIDDPAAEVFVVEASSFRLGHSHRFSPRVATWLNFAPDHLDAHESLASYEEAKASMWAHLGPDAVVVANADDPIVAAHAPSAVDVQWFSLSDAGASWHVADGHLVGPDGPFVAIDEMPRSQPHDLANGLAVAATASAGGATMTAVADTLRAFTGLPHRLQLIGEWQGIRWYDDSKATVPQATQVAVAGFASVVLIAGGRNKGLSLDGLRETAPPVRAVVAIGDASTEVQAQFDGIVPVTVAADMAEAVAAAAEMATVGDAVLLSPGCTSFDWYKSYGERGDDFARLVHERVGG